MCSLTIEYVLLLQNAFSVGVCERERDLECVLLPKSVFCYRLGVAAVRAADLRLLGGDCLVLPGNLPCMP